MRDTAARNPKQELRNVATVLPAIKHAGKYVEKGNEALRTKNESKRISVVMFHDVNVKSEARDNKRLTSKENKGGDKPKRRGNHNQGGNQNNFRGRASKQNKAVLTLDPAPEPTKTTSVKILDEMGNEVKEKLPNNRDSDNGALLAELCQKVIEVCETYKLYNENGGLDDDGRDGERNGDGKSTNMCRTLGHNHA